MATYTNSLNFPNLTVKAAPVGADIILIADSAAGNEPKQSLISTLPFAPLGGSTIVNVTGATQAMSVDTTYIVNYVGGQCVLTLPSAASSAQGSFVKVIGGQANTAGFQIASNAGQQMNVDSAITTATTGTLTSTDAFATINLISTNLAGGLVYSADSVVGNFAVT